MRSDRVVLPYAKMASDHPCQCIFFGTINPGERLSDRRHGQPAILAGRGVQGKNPLIAQHRDQMWAEAYAAFWPMNSGG